MNLVDQPQVSEYYTGGIYRTVTVVFCAVKYISTVGNCFIRTFQTLL
jgi:hypothetical protein